MLKYSISGSKIVTQATDNPQELVLIRPWSFPSRFHRSWDKLEPFASKVTRNSFPPVLDFVEEEE
jgi:hypothetical protein